MHVSLNPDIFCVQPCTQVYDKISDDRENDIVSKPKLLIVDERQDFQEKIYGHHKVCCDDDGATDAALVEEEI